MAKLETKWNCGMFIGAKTRSNELIVIDQDTKEIRYVRTVRRVPEEQRWSPDNLAWGQQGSLEHRAGGRGGRRRDSRVRGEAWAGPKVDPGRS